MPAYDGERHDVLRERFAASRQRALTSALEARFIHALGAHRAVKRAPPSLLLPMLAVA
jgi:hypothetical protein